MWKVMEECHKKNPYIIIKQRSLNTELMKKMFAQDKTTIINGYTLKIMNDQPKTAILFRIR